MNRTTLAVSRRAPDELRGEGATRLSFKIVGIGASAGGLEAFTELLRHLPVKAGLAYVLVQHLDPTHRSLLSELLAKATTLPVQEITDETRPEANKIYVIPPNSNLRMEGGLLKLSPRQRTQGPARSIDLFLKSLAADQKANAIGVILSGAGSDGAAGLKAIKDAGGLTFAQDTESAKHDSMPRAAVAAGCVDFVLPPAKIADEISQIVSTPAGTKRRAAANAKKRSSAEKNSGRFAEGVGTGIRWPAGPQDADLRKLFLLLRSKSGIDFSYYKPNTIRRRLTRRISMQKVKGLGAYVRFLREHPGEVEALYQDLLINVTSFFRNPRMWDSLKRKVFPKLIKAHGDTDALRMWIAGCSTGQEAYSYAMAYSEFASENGIHVPLQIFATDVNPAVLEHARAGRYLKSQLDTVSKPRRQRFFHEEDGCFRVQKAIRDLVIFAQQNLLTDPPFTRVDVISCRNMLIYVDTALQQKIIPTFHYALKPGGFLVLGSSETVGQFTNLFAPTEKSQKIFVKKPAASWIRVDRPMAPAKTSRDTHRSTPDSVEMNVLDAQKEADRLILANYAPVSVLVNEAGEILQLRGDAGKYLELPTGKAVFLLSKMVRNELAVPLQKVLQRAKRDHKPVRERNINLGGRRGSLDIEVVPLRNVKAHCYLIIFEKATPRNESNTSNGNGNGNGNGHSALEERSRADAKETTELKREIEEAQEHIRVLQEEHETAVEELQASNEEVQSSNEELQSLNEELETSNEELESANEELTTLNEELATRNAELRESERLLREQAELLDMAPVIARSPRERIVYWGKGAEQLYGFTKEEAMGQTSHLLLSTQLPEPMERIQAALQKHGKWEGELITRKKDGTAIMVTSQWVVHHDENKKIRAVLQVDTDITGRKVAEKALRESEQFNRGILQSTPDAIAVIDTERRIQFTNKEAKRWLGGAHEAGIVEWAMLWSDETAGRAEEAMRAALAGEIARFQAVRREDPKRASWWDVVVRGIANPGGKVERMLCVAREVTDQKLEEIATAERAQLSALRADVVLTLSRTGDTQAILQQVSDALVKHLGAAFARVWTANEQEGMLELRASAGMYTHLDGRHARIKVGEMKVGRIAAQRRAHLTNDVCSDAEVDSAWAKREGLTAFAGYPLLVEGRNLGVVAVFSKHPMSEQVLHELGYSAEALAQFIDRRNIEQDRGRFFDESQQARIEVDLLNEIGNKIAAELNLDNLTQSVTEAASRLVRAQFGLFVYKAGGDQRETAIRYAVSGMPRSRFSTFSDPSPHWAGALSVAPVRSPDVSTDSRFPENSLAWGVPEDTHVRSYLAVPVVSRSGEALGRLVFGHTRADMFRDREEKIVAGLAALAGIAIDNARLFDQLERKVVERTARLQDTISELQAFSYTVSHDLRAPLRAMQSYAQMLQREYTDRLDDMGREYLSRIERAGVRLDRLIQDVLTYSRISRAEITLHPVDLDKLIRDIVQQYPNLQPPAAQIEIDGTLPKVMAEESSTTQCFSNLLGNAVKFVPQGRSPKVRITSEQRGEFIRVWVEDNGIGIEPCHHDRIFKMFERLDTTKTYEGTGIGLAIVRKAVERMGGQVGVESILGEGCRFWLEFKKP